MKRYIIIFISLFGSIALVAQEVTLKANYPPVVTAGEQFAVSWNANANGSFNAPSFNGFYKLAGPQTSYSSSTQVINGKFSQQTSYTFTFFLQATNEGKFVIPPATITVKNKEYKSDSLYIEVLKDNSQVQPTQRNEKANQQEAGAATPNSDLFIRLIVSRNEVYQGEYIVATAKIYSRIDISGLNEVKFPDFKGFLNEQLETPQLTSLQRENVGGVLYGTGVVQQFLLYPQITGDLTIDPVRITALIQQKTGNADPFFGDFFTQYTNIPKVIASAPVTIKVKPLPGAKPVGFSGIVGKISMTASINKDSVNVNDAVNFKVTISGTGNLKLAGNPAFTLSPDLDVFEPKITDNIKNSINGTTGQKTFEYVIIPRHYGEFRIPVLSYSYFNTTTGKYETLTSPEYKFYARKGSDQGGAVTVYGGVSKEDVRYIGKDIRFIKPGAGKYIDPGKIIVSRKSFMSLYGLALILFFIILFLRREHVRRNADISSVRNRKAAKVAGKRLEEASRCLKTGMLDKFHEEILKALWGYLSDKLRIPVSGLTRITATEALIAKGIDEKLISDLTEILDKCEFARFAPAASGSEAADLYTGAMNFIKSVENNI
jgi:hypothetical protein